MNTVQSSSLRYWELRRPLAIALAAFGWYWGWDITVSLDAGIDDLPIARYEDLRAFTDITLSVFIVNAVFSLGYVGEFFSIEFAAWRRVIRTPVMLILMILSLFFGLRFGGIAAHTISLGKAIWPAMYGKPSHAPLLPNQSLEPTPKSVTDRAAHAPRQPWAWLTIKR